MEEVSNRLAMATLSLMMINSLWRGESYSSYFS